MQDTEFIVLPVDPRRALVLFDDCVAPTGEYDAVYRDVRGEVLPLGAQGLLDDREGLNDRLKAILAAEGQMLQHQRQHPPIVPHKLSPHDRLVPATVLRVTSFRLGHEIVEGGFFDTGEEHMADGAVGCLHDGFRDPIQQLDLPDDSLDILEEGLLEMLLCLRINAPNHLQRHPDSIVRHFHGADMDKTGQQRISYWGRMRAHPTRILIVGPALEELQDFEGDVCEGLRWQRQHP